MGEAPIIGSSVSGESADQASRGTMPAASATSATQPRAAAGGARRYVTTLIIAAGTILLVDIVTKLVAVARLSDRGPVDIIPGVLDLRLTRNSGAAFSLAGGATVILSLVALAVVGVVIFTARRLRSVGWSLVLGALLGGAVGNLTDRLFRAPGPLRGHVVDFVHLHHWPIFNVADSAIVCGGALAVVLSLRGIGLDGARYAGPVQGPGPSDGGPSDVAGPDVAAADVAEPGVAEAPPAGGAARGPGEAAPGRAP